MKYIIILLMAGLLIGCSEAPAKEIPNNQQFCVAQGGNYIAESNECTDISKEICDEMGGQFNECASACRNNPDAEICTMQCVLVCDLN